ncbi:hypothetical protein [Flavivirga spongiicola]|uniref:Uncharacterized protein n=1 Tax=Flavivirga spongiicola TaxID=421621 RepID=A0ABU7Y094_9FLAO|nr:hypothetical protein [Flavivirga sp. MEBiC05379]MDO5981135.1 hypothetical protein [Flavivirga sp. MEBiC05379]
MAKQDNNNNGGNNKPIPRNNPSVKPKGDDFSGSGTGTRPKTDKD